MAYYVPPPEKVVGTRPPCPPPNCTHSETQRYMMRLPTSGRQSLFETLHPKAPRAPPALPSWDRHPSGM